MRIQRIYPRPYWCYFFVPFRPWACGCHIRCRGETKCGLYAILYMNHRSYYTSLFQEIRAYVWHAPPLSLENNIAACSCCSTCTSRICMLGTSRRYILLRLVRYRINTPCLAVVRQVVCHNFYKLAFDNRCRLLGQSVHR